MRADNDLLIAFSYNAYVGRSTLELCCIALLGSVLSLGPWKCLRCSRKVTDFLVFDLDIDTREFGYETTNKLKVLLCLLVVVP